MNRKRKKRGASSPQQMVKNFFQVFGTVLLVLVLSVLIFTCIFAVYIKTDLAEQTELSVQDFTLNQTSIIYYEDKQTGQWLELQRLYDEENRIWVSYDEIPQDLINACIAIEDKRFYEHQGVDWITTGKASLRLFLGSGGAGGSTITQQLMKNLTRDEEITIRRKIVEIFRALDFEKRHSKAEIMELYLNVIYLGQGCNGVRSASQVYFGKDVSELTLAECASLIGITNNPSIYDPYQNPENNRQRQMIILGQMLDQEMISREEYDAAVAQEMVFTSKRADEAEEGEKQSAYYSYFVDQVIRDVIADLAEQGDYSESIAKKMLYGGGYSIYCTMDPEVQEVMESVYGNTANVPKTTSSQQLQSAMVVIDNASGDVVGIVGGVGDKGGSLTLSRAAQSKLSPGSAIKPITVYSPALDRGMITPISVYDDTPFSFDEGKPYPKNQNGRYRGLVSVDFAVGQSLNTVAIKLVDEMTPEYCYNFAREKMGLTTLVDNVEINGGVFTDKALAPLAMGGLTQGITVRALTNAYAALANDGYYRSARTYTKVVGPDEKVILDNVQEKHTAVSAKTAWYMTSMLNNATVSGTSTQARLPGIDVAAKTGTTTSDHDRWFAAYTPYYTAAVWCGFDDPEEIHVTSTSTNPSLYMWKQVMTVVHEDLPNRQFVRPDGMVWVDYCQDSGLIATAACTADPRGSRMATALLFKEDIPTEECSVHTHADICSVSNQPAGEYCALYGAEVKSVGMLSLNRLFPVPEITVEDQQYAVAATTEPPTGYYPAVGGPEVCSVHAEPPAPEVPEASNPTEPQTPSETDAEAVPAA